ncbi:MAG: hypothetical protein NTW86_28025, partial [Candidatus Sumerlaeota bacterium]|nr:hypothetical protein [Candidatus Sumerlaeota bacterium]
VGFVGAEGFTYYCHVRANDNAGNTGAFSDASDGILVDLTAPVSAVAAPSGHTTSDTLTVVWNATDPVAVGSVSGVQSVSVYWNRNGGAYTALGTFSAGTTSAPFDADAHGGLGVYGFYSVATDQAGNVETPPAGNDVAVTVAESSVTSWRFYK